MRPPGVAEPGPVIDDLFCLEAVGDLVQIHNLLLQGPPEPLDENIVQIPSSPSTGILITASVKVLIQSAPRLLAALFHIHYFQLSIFGDGRLQCLNAEAGIPRV